MPDAPTPPPAIAPADLAPDAKKKFTRSANNERIADQTEAKGDAMKTTEERNAAYAAMKAPLKIIKGTLKGALRGQPALLAKLGL